MPSGSILVTGANGGLGTGFVLNLLKSAFAGEYRGLYTVRNPSTAHELQAVLKKAPAGHKSEILALDLSKLESVRAAAADINARVSAGTLEPIRALVLNAGWQEANSNTLAPQAYTADGLEAAFGVNYLANFLFVLLVLQSMDKEHGRIVMVSSYTHDAYDKSNNTMGIYTDEKYKLMYPDTETLSKGITYDDDGFKAGMRRYGASKLLMVMFMYELQRRLESDPVLSNVSVLSMDPGGMGGTGIARRGPAVIVFFITWVAPLLQRILDLFMTNPPIRTTNRSGSDLLRACFDVETLTQFPKAVYLDGSLNSTSSQESRDVKKQKQLWVDSLKLAKVIDGDTVLKNWQ